MSQLEIKSLEREKIRDIRKSLRLSQKVFGKKLGVTKMTVVRWESGESTCKGAHAENIIKLEQVQTYSNIIPGTTTIFSLTCADLSSLDSMEAVRVFRDFLFCECRRVEIPIKDVHICETEIPDGGIDASVNNNVTIPKNSNILPGLNSFQIKSGKKDAPWQDGWIKEELFGKRKDSSRETLGPAIRKCLDDGGRYILVCFGIEMTEKRISETQEKFKGYFKSCGYLDAKVDIWAQEQLIGMFSAFPSLCLQITKRDNLCFKDHLSWNMDSNMQNEFHTSQDINTLNEEIRTHLRKNDRCHIRLIGKNGIGKTRLVLEILSSKDLAPLVVYISDSEDFQKTPLFNKLCRSDSEYFVILVLDNCPPQKCKEIWNSLSSRSNRCKIISIDQGYYNTSDSSEYVFECPLLVQDGIQKIIQKYVGETHDLTRWSIFCGNLPSMAHMLGRNLRDCPEDILREPSTGWIWDKYVIGHSPYENTEHRRVVLEYLSLFKRFGFEEPKKEESRFICELVQRGNPDIGWDKFQFIIVTLKKEHILEGTTTLCITPDLLHFYLYDCFWKKHIDFISAELIETMPPQLAIWFWQMFCYAPNSRVVIQQIEQLLNPQKPIHASKMFGSKESNILNELSSAFPNIVLNYIEAKMDQLSREELLRFTEGRQDLVWAFEKILWREALFNKAARTLLKLAEAENASNSNNSKGTFVRLFSLTSGSAPTKASFEKRLQILTYILLDSSSTFMYQVGLEACEEAFSIHSKCRLIGSEYQGLQATFSPWVPKTWDEHRKQYKTIWDLLVTSINKRSMGDRAKAIFILIQSGRDLLEFDWMQETILNTFEELIDDEATDLNYFLCMLTELIRFKFHKLSSELLAKLKELEMKITGTTFHSRVRRWVFFATYNDNYNNGEDGAGNQQIKRLALEAVSNSDLLKEKLANLVVGKNMAIFEFGKCIGQLDKNRNLFIFIKNSYIQNVLNATTFFLSGYLKGIFELNPAEWEVFIYELIEDNSFCKLIGLLIRDSGFTDASIEKLFCEYEKGKFNIDSLLCFRHSSELKFLKLKNIQKLINYLLEKNKSIDALKILKYIYCHNKKCNKLPEELTYQTLREVTISASFDTMSDYAWNIVADEFISQFPEKSYDIFESILDRICKSADRFFSSEIIHKVINNDSTRFWSLMASKINLLDQSSKLQFMYGCKANSINLSYFPLKSILNWVAECPRNRAVIIAQMVSPVFKEDSSDCLVRELLHRYPDQVEDTLLQNFLSGMYMGSESVHFQSRCDKAKQWIQAETSIRVVEWLEKYIYILSKLIEDAKIREERFEF